ncbi:MAG: glycosyltransferase family 4 protein, partial [Thaumarchaeota archaeon]|nr:glycosyltransferase family 4 protein [Nitrososphaerota archaeon]
MSLRVFMLVRELATGTQTYTENIIRELMKNGVEVVVGYTGKRPGYLPCELVRLDRNIPRSIDHMYLAQLFRFLFVLPTIRDCFRRFKPHVIFAQGLDENSLIALVASYIFHKPAISFVHDLTLNELKLSDPHRFGVSFLYAISLLRQKISATKLSTVLVGSNFMRDSLARMFEIIPKVTILGVDDRFGRVKSTNNWAPFQIIFIGNLNRKKRPEIPMRAMVELNNLDIRLTYVGDGPRKKELMELCNELGVTDKVKILGRVSLEELLSTLQTVHVCVVPSMWEGFGLAAAEAIKAGVPVLASD